MRVRVTVIVEPGDGDYYMSNKGGYDLLRKVEKAVMDEEAQQEGAVGDYRFHGEVVHSQRVNTYQVGER